MAVSKKNNYLRAALAAHVAAWDSYLNKLVIEFVNSTTSPLDVEYSSMHSVYVQFATRTLEKFNTPNSNNSRVLLTQCTGYDPINDWVRRSAGMNGLQVRNFLDEILRVRYSFAHGFELPNCSWTVTSTGTTRLNIGSVQKYKRFLSHLVFATDRGLGVYGTAHYPSKRLW